MTDVCPNGHHEAYLRSGTVTCIAWEPPDANPNTYTYHLYCRRCGAEWTEQRKPNGALIETRVTNPAAIPESGA